MDLLVSHSSRQVKGSLGTTASLRLETGHGRDWRKRGSPSLCSYYWDVGDMAAWKAEA